MTTFIDTHTHIYDDAFREDRDAMIQRALEQGVETFLLPAIDSEHHTQMLDLVSAYPENCFPMMGLHPTSVKEEYRAELDLVERYLADSQFRFVAIGEIGIDLYWDKSHEREQVEAFSKQLDLAIRFDLPVVIHTRNSMEVTLDIIEKNYSQKVRGVFHCFSGNVAQANRATGLGFMLGIGGVVTYKNSGLQKVVETVSIEHLLLETDAPWLPPVPHRGQRNEPAYIPIIARKIAEIKGLTESTIAQITTNNAKRTFKGIRN